MNIKFKWLLSRVVWAGEYHLWATIIIIIMQVNNAPAAEERRGNMMHINSRAKSPLYYACHVYPIFMPFHYDVN